MNLHPIRRTKSTDAETPSPMRADRLAQSEQRFHHRVRNTIALLVLVGGGLFGIHAASAYFTSNGAGTGSGTAGTLVAPSGVTATAAQRLFPGGNADLSVTLNNTNSYSIEVAGIAQGGSITVSSGCTTPAVTVPTQTLASPVTVAPGTHTVTIPNGLSMGIASSSDCQDATFSTIPITLTVKAP
ncbi:MAG: hypothetical protein JWM72_849 [Actinomycetia bacterium]|nr:hypothetical protein [Actinomycetes bacterium]